MSVGPLRWTGQNKIFFFKQSSVKCSVVLRLMFGFALAIGKQSCSKFTFTVGSFFPPIHPFPPFFLYVIIPWTFKWATQIPNHLDFLQNYLQPTALTRQMFTKMLMFWSLPSFPSPHLVSDRSICWWFWRLIIAPCYQTRWDGSMRKLHFYGFAWYGLVWWTWVFCCVITFCGDNWDCFHLLHPNLLPVWGFDLVTFQFRTSLSQLLPFTHTGKLTLNTSHPYHHPVLTRWTPEKTTCSLFIFTFSSASFILFHSIKPPPTALQYWTVSISLFLLSHSLMLHKGEKWAIYYSADKKIFQPLIYRVDFFPCSFH